jgi:hypothetical protein
MIEPKHQCLLSNTYTATDGFRVGPSPPDYVCKIPRRRTLEQNSIIFFVDQRPKTSSTLHLVQQYKEQAVGPCRPLSGEGVVTLQQATRSAQITKKLSYSVIQRLELSGTLRLARLYYALYPVILKERLTHNILPHRNSAQRRRGTPGRTGRVKSKSGGRVKA